MNEIEAPLLTAALIVRNEEFFLEDCLKSICGLADEILVGDTGSTDGSIEIARSFGARVLPVEWREDFAQARNRVLDRARGRWILSIDADERLTPFDAAAVRGVLESTSQLGMDLRFLARPNLTCVPRTRLFRNEADIRFEGIIHEDVEPALGRRCRDTGTGVGEVELRIEHWGFEHGERGKHARNLPLLLRELEIRPEQILAWCHLADILGDLGRGSEALQAHGRALELARRAEDRNPRHGALAFLSMIEWKLENDEDPEDLVQEALPLFPRQKHLLWLHARRLMARSRVGEAIPFLEQVACFERSMTDDSYGYDEKLYQRAAAEGLAACAQGQENPAAWTEQSVGRTGTATPFRVFRPWHVSRPAPPPTLADAGLVE